MITVIEDGRDTFIFSGGDLQYEGDHVALIDLFTIFLPLHNDSDGESVYRAFLAFKASTSSLHIPDL